MVEGLLSFKEKFQGYEECYTIIGGTACDILMTEAQLPFRRTKDIDIILILEDRQKEFAKKFWEYIKEGEYRCGWKNNNEMHFYRFTDPLPGYPAMIELFSRKPGYHLDVEAGIVPVHINDDVSSLSAILLQEDFYQFMLKGRKNIEGVSVLTAEYLIPFKMYAWLDLKKEKQQGNMLMRKTIKNIKMMYSDCFSL